MDNTIAYNKKDCNLENWKVDFPWFSDKKIHQYFFKNIQFL